MSPAAWFFAGIALASLAACGAVLWFSVRITRDHLALIAALNGKGRELAQALAKEAPVKKDEKERVRAPQVT